nr:hypothetical protein [Xanthomonas arboricola]
MSGRHHRPRRIFRMISALALCLVLPAAPAAAADSIPPGDWRGILSTSGGTGPVYAVLRARAGRCFDCLVRCNDRGYCRRLSDSQARMQMRPDDSAVLSLLLNGRRDVALFERVP